MQPTLVILAAGMASRYGSMKQVQSFGPSGETIMEYSIYDAIKAGFGKVVFIIRYITQNYIYLIHMLQKLLLKKIQRQYHGWFINMCLTIMPAQNGWRTLLIYI